MNIATKSIKLALICELCQTNFNTTKKIPKMLQCGHTICLDCVTKLQSKKIEKCPFDKKTINLDDDKLVHNFFILSLIETDLDKVLIDPLIFPSETINLTPKSVVNSPGWKNTVDGFILNNNILISSETNGFIYCTDLETSEWWFMYLNQFCAKFLFKIKESMFCIDYNGNLYQIFMKNYYTQIGRKGCWKNTTHVCVIEGRLFTIENNSKVFETNVENGKWKEIVNLDSDSKCKKNFVKKQQDQSNSSHGSTPNNNESGSSNIANENNFNYNQSFELDSFDDNFDSVKNVKAIFSNEKKIYIINRAFELYEFDPISCTRSFTNIVVNKKFELYCSNKTHIYFIELNGKIIYRSNIKEHSKINKVLDKDFIEEKLKNNKNFVDEKIFKNVETFYDLKETSANRIICNDQKLVVIDKQGSLLTIDLNQVTAKHSDCRFMIRNCQMSNLAILGDGNLLILDPIRLSLNKLNIINGSETIILHSQKFLNSIKYLFTNGVSKVYLIYVTGNLFYFNEAEKKLVQIGNTNICKNAQKFCLFKNYLFVHLEEDTLMKINLNDGDYNDVKLNLIKNSDYLYGDNVNFVIVNCKKNEILITDPNDNFSVKKSIFYDFKHISAVTLFKNYLITYDNFTKNVVGINIDDGSVSDLVKDFPEIFLFVNNFDCLACILKDGVIYTLYY